MPRKFKEKECAMCEVSYTPTSSVQKFCKECGPERRRQRQRKRLEDPEYRKRRNQKQKERSRERYKNPEAVKERRRYNRERYKKPEEKEKKKEYQQRPEVKERRARNRKEWEKRNKDHIAEYKQRPEVKERRNQLAKEKYKDPEVREKLKKRVNDRAARPEIREKICTYMKAYRQKNKENGTAALYLILNTLNGYVYIGESVFYERRKYDHEMSLKSGRHDNKLLQKDYDKYGPDAFEFSIIKEINKEDFLNEGKLKEHLLEEEVLHSAQAVNEGKVLYNKDPAINTLARVLKERLAENELNSPSQ